MRISDWSSDVCSSDLQQVRRPAAHAGGRQGQSHGRYAINNSQGEDDYLPAPASYPIRQLTARVAARSRCAAGPLSSAWNREVGPTMAIHAGTWPTAWIGRGSCKDRVWTYG